MYKPKGGCNDQLALGSKLMQKYVCDAWCWSGRHIHQRKLRNSMPMKSEGRSDMHLSSLANIGVTQRCHSIIPMSQRACRGKFELDACQGALLHGCQGRFTSWLANIWYVHELVVRKLWYVCKWINKDCKACKIYDMLASASTWLAKFVHFAAILLLKNKHCFI